MGTVLCLNLKNTALVYYRERLHRVAVKRKGKPDPVQTCWLSSLSQRVQACLHAHLVMSDLLWPPWIIAHGLLCPWDLPGKNTGVGCHFSRGSSRPRDQTCISCIGRHILHPCATWEGPGNGVEGGPGSLWVRCRRVVWRLYKGVTDPLPCRSRGFELLLTKIPSQTQRERPGLRNVRGQVDTSGPFPLVSSCPLHLSFILVNCRRDAPTEGMEAKPQFGIFPAWQP